jgi:hypothetical protein
MSQNLTLELSEQVYVAIQQQAQAVGLSPSQLVATLVEKQFTQAFKQLDKVEKDTARLRFERHFGSLVLDHPTNVDNESIDDDLAREYASTHEDD